MTAGELINIFKQNNIPNDAILMSDSGWECCATDMDGIYYNKLKMQQYSYKKLVSITDITDIMTGLFVETAAKRWRVNDRNRR